MTTKHSILPLLFVLISGCTTTATPLKEAKPAPADRVLAFQTPSLSTGAIVVTRDTGMLGGGCYYALAINGKLAARFDTKETATFYVEPGEILLRTGRDPQGLGLCAAGQEWWTQRETTVKTGEKKWFRFVINSDGTTDIQRSE